MDVLGVGVKLQLAAVDVLQNLRQALADGLLVFFRDNALFPQHGGVGNAALDVLAVHHRIKGDGAVKVVDPTVDFFFEPSCPHGHGVFPPILTSLRNADRQYRRNKGSIV